MVLAYAAIDDNDELPGGDISGFPGRRHVDQRNAVRQKRMCCRLVDIDSQNSGIRIGGELRQHGIRQLRRQRAQCQAALGCIDGFGVAAGQDFIENALMR